MQGFDAIYTKLARPAGKARRARRGEFEVRNSRFSERRTQNVEPRVAPVAHVLPVSRTLHAQVRRVRDYGRGAPCGFS
jgi:hypothetical protein